GLMPGSDGMRWAAGFCAASMSSPNSDWKSEMRRITVPDGLSNIDSLLKFTAGCGLSSSCTDPIAILSPGLTCDSETRLPLTLTPFVDFRSTIHHALLRDSKR